jgi:DNA-binding NarL/FixJ family response regulator
MDIICSEYKDKRTIVFEDICGKYLLSPREREVLRGLLKGMQIKEIALHLKLSVNTVRNHTHRIYKKCKVQNRIELANIFAHIPPV